MHLRLGGCRYAKRGGEGNIVCRYGSLSKRGCSCLVMRATAWRRGL